MDDPLLFPLMGLTEFEKVVVTPLMESGILKFYCTYINAALVLIQ